MRCDIVGAFQIPPVIWRPRHYAVLPPLVTTLVPVVFFQTSAQASFHFSNVFAFTTPHGILQTTPRCLLAGTISFSEDRTVLSLIIDLEIARVRCLNRTRFKVSPNALVQGKMTLDINSGDLLCYFFFLF